MSALAHVFEAAGIATVTLASIRSVAARMQVPRALYCEFPLGRPLGKPGDAAFQRDVLTRAFAMLNESAGPVLIDHPDIITDEVEALSCSVPAAFDADELPAIAEAKGLRKAWDRSFAERGATGVGRAVDPDGLPDAFSALNRIVEGTPWKEAGIPGKITTQIVHDIRTYYEEAAMELVDGPVPDGRAAEAWFYEQTEAGKLVMAARAAIKEQKGPHAVWFYMAPAHR